MNILPRIYPKLLRGIKSIPVTKDLIKYMPDLTGTKLRPFTHSARFLTALNQNGILHHPTGGFSKSCRCGSAGLHTKGDKELVDFLVKEIAEEKKTHNDQNPAAIKEYEVKTEGSDLILTKNLKDEVIKIKLNVNHTVDTDVPEVDSNPQQDTSALAELTSKPTFTVEVTKGKSTLAFSCSFTQQDSLDDAPADGENDLFNIDEVSIHDGEWKETVYAVSGQIMDGYLYDLLMNLLDERGINNEFVESLSAYCTSYEHGLYIGLLEKIKGFASSQ